MIPQAYITEWSQQVPWIQREQVEQDLVICRALLEIYSDEWLGRSLAFRGGTALHKLYLHPQPRYSEDIDLVQLRSEPIKETIQRLQHVLSFLGNAAVLPRKDGIRLVYRYDSEFIQPAKMRLKVEINTREHFSLLGYEQIDFQVNSSWISETAANSSCRITTYRLEELLGTKLRALYQRRKGRDLFDLYTALRQRPAINTEDLLQSYYEYISFSVDTPPNRKIYTLNVDAKMQDSDFLGDTTALLRPDLIYDPVEAYELVRMQLIENM